MCLQFVFGVEFLFSSMPSILISYSTSIRVLESGMIVICSFCFSEHFKLIFCFDSIGPFDECFVGFQGRVQSAQLFM
jgi:hypothetical protein